MKWNERSQPRAGGLALLVGVAGLLALAGCDRPPTETKRPVTGCDVPPAAGPGRVVWSAPVVIPLPVGWNAGSPSLVVERGRMYLALAAVQAGASGPPRDILLMAGSGGGWSPPERVSEGERPAGAPRLALDARGEPHLLWSVQLRDSTPSGLSWRPDALLHRARGTEGWGQVDTLHRSEVLALLPPARPVLDRAGRLHVLFKGEPEPRRAAELLHQVWEAGRWLPRRSLNRSGGNAEMMVARDGRLLTVFVDGVATIPGERDINSVFFTSSGDGGVSWTPARLILRAGRFPAHWPQIAQNGDGRIHLLWQRDTTGGILPHVFEHTHSADGECWAEPVRITPPDRGLSAPPEIVSDGAGGLHLVFAFLNNSRNTADVYYAYWERGQWSPPERMFEFEAMGGVDLVRDEGGTLHLIVIGRSGGVDQLYHLTSAPGARRASEAAARRLRGNG